MGIIRLLLALSVVGGHLIIPHFWSGTGGKIAVEAFFMISGFYMCLVLDKTYRHGVRHFYFNRALRLFPIYWVVAGASLCFSLATHPPCIEQFQSLPTFTKTLLAVTNFTLFGQDWVMFLGPTHCRRASGAGVRTRAKASYPRPPPSKGGGERRPRPKPCACP